MKYLCFCFVLTLTTSSIYHAGFTEELCHGHVDAAMNLIFKTYSASLVLFVFNAHDVGSKFSGGKLGKFGMGFGKVL